MTTIVLFNRCDRLYVIIVHLHVTSVQLTNLRHRVEYSVTLRQFMFKQ